MNLSNHHFYYKASYELSEFITPLSKHHISFFSYAKSYRDGARIYLSTHPQMFEKYLSMKYYLQGNVESAPNNYSHQFVLWSTLKNQTCYEFARLFDIDHGLYLICPNEAEESCEFIAFASTAAHPEIANFYLNNLDVLQSFVSQFRNNAHHLILQAENHKIILPFSEENINCFKVKPTESQKESKPQKAKFTAREHDCINMLIRGNTIKEIAKHLELSPRTIEDYILSLRHKLGAKSKVDLVIKLLETKLSNFNV